jgi:hypothetical protein
VAAELINWTEVTPTTGVLAGLDCGVLGTGTVVVIGPLSTLLEASNAAVVAGAAEADTPAFDALSRLLPAPHAVSAADIRIRSGREVYEVRISELTM